MIASEMKNPISNSEFFSLKQPLRLRIKPPKSGKREEEVMDDEKYSSTPLIEEEAIKEGLPMSDQERRKPTCSVCHKSFDSVKAVQGHMRIHPKIPGQKKKRSAAIDECKMMTSKKVKLSNSNRERKRKNHQEDNAIRVSDNPGSGEQEKMINAALILLHMKHGMDWEEYIHQNLTTDQGDVSDSSNAELAMGPDTGITVWATHNIPESSVQINPVEAESLKEKESLVNSSTQKEKGKEMMMIASSTGPTTRIPESAVHVEAESLKEKERTQIPTAKEKGKEMMIARKYVCSICDESFSSHQALGGHQTRHREEKLELGGGGGGRGGHKKKKVERDHVCEICGEVYPTGQQLGGHKRKHFMKKPIGESSSSVISMEQGKRSTTTPVIDKEKGEVAMGDVGDGVKEQSPVERQAPGARVARDFDLNVAAVPMEEDAW